MSGATSCSILVPSLFELGTSGALDARLLQDLDHFLGRHHRPGIVAVMHVRVEDRQLRRHALAAEKPAAATQRTGLAEDAHRCSFSGPSFGGQA